MKIKLSELQAYSAVAKLFQIYYDIDPAGDLGGVLGSMAFLQDKKPVDSVMLRDWRKCLDIILGHKNLRNYKYSKPLDIF